MTSLVTLSKSTCQTILSDSDFVYAASDEKGTLLATLRGLHNGKSIWITETNQYAVEGISRLSPLLLKALHQDAKGIPIFTSDDECPHTKPTDQTKMWLFNKNTPPKTSPIVNATEGCLSL